MPAEVLAEIESSRRARHVVAALFVVAVFAWGLAFYGLGFYLNELPTRGGWSIGLLSGLTFVFYAISTVLGFLVGMTLQRTDGRPVFLTGAAALGAAAIAMGTATSTAQLVAAYLLLAVGWACLNMNPISSTVLAWYGDRSSMPLTVALTGASAGGIVMIPILVWLKDAIGFTSGLVLVGVLEVLIVGGLALTIVRTPSRPTGAPSEAARIAWTVATRRTFWLLTLGLALAIAVQVGFLVHQLRLLTTVVTDEAAASVVAATTAAALTGRLLFIASTRRAGPAWPGLAFIALQIAALLGLGLGRQSARGPRRRERCLRPGRRRAHHAAAAADEVEYSRPPVRGNLSPRQCGLCRGRCRRCAAAHDSPPPGRGLSEGSTGARGDRCPRAGSPRARPDVGQAIDVGCAVGSVLMNDRRQPTVTVLGGGSWGTTVASTAARNTPTVLWLRNEAIATAINDTHQNPQYLPDLDLSPDLRATTDLEEAVSLADVLVMGVPSQEYRKVLETVAPIIRPWVPIVSLVKGFELATRKRMTEITAEVLPGHPGGRARRAEPGSGDRAGLRRRGHDRASRSRHRRHAATALPHEAVPGVLHRGRHRRGDGRGAQERVRDRRRHRRRPRGR